MHLKEEMYFKTIEDKLKEPKPKDKINFCKEKLQEKYVRERNKHVLELRKNQSVKKADSYKTQTTLNETGAYRVL